MRNHLALACLCGVAAAFSTTDFLGCRSYRSCAYDRSSSHKHYQSTLEKQGLSEQVRVDFSRRSFFSSAFPLTFLISIGVDVKSASARDELFKPNPLTNPILEQFRIWEQAEADQQKYGGELAPGSAIGRDTYAKLLLPILRMEKNINKVYNLVREPEGSGLDKANEILSKPEFQTLGFKKIFNTFGKFKQMSFDT